MILAWNYLLYFCVNTKNSKRKLKRFGRRHVGHIRDLTKLQRLWQRQKAIALVIKKQLCVCIRPFLYISLPPCTTATWNDHVLSFSCFEDGNGKTINSPISVWTWARPPLFSSNTNFLLLSNWANLDNCEMVWKDAESLLLFSEVFMDVIVVVW